MKNQIKELTFADLATELAPNLSGLVVLSGGSTIPPLVQELSEKIEDGREIIWTWNDERIVPYDHPGSNFGTVRDLIKVGRKVPLPDEDTPRDAEEYMHALCPRDGMPQIDHLILGFGDDGHIASLFPGSTALNFEGYPLTWVAQSIASYEPKRRWTWVMSALTPAKKVTVLYRGATDGAKAERLREALEDADCDTPLARFLRLSEGEKSFVRIVE